MSGSSLTKPVWSARQALLCLRQHDTLLFHLFFDFSLAERKIEKQGKVPLCMTACKEGVRPATQGTRYKIQVATCNRPSARNSIQYRPERRKCRSREPAESRL